VHVVGVVHRRLDRRGMRAGEEEAGGRTRRDVVEVVQERIEMGRTDGRTEEEAGYERVVAVGYVGQSA